MHRKKKIPLTKIYQNIFSYYYAISFGSKKFSRFFWRKNITFKTQKENTLKTFSRLFSLISELTQLC